MQMINLDDVNANLQKIITNLSPGEQVMIVQNGESVATLTRTATKQWPCSAGSAKDTEHWMAEDFDAPLKEFQGYMQ